MGSINIAKKIRKEIKKILIVDDNPFNVMGLTVDI